MEFIINHESAGSNQAQASGNISMMCQCESTCEISVRRAFLSRYYLLSLSLKNGPLDTASRQTQAPLGAIG
ncbi:hypothetical protein ACXHP8_23515 [Vibrio antiquarius]